MVSGLGTTLAYIDYNRKVFKGETKPNGATWGIWSAIALVSSSSYLASTGDFWKGILPLANIVLCIGTFSLALISGKFKKLNFTDWCALVIGLIAVIVWKFTTASYANLVVQGAIIFGFIPTWIGIWKTPSCEMPRPWWVWSASYTIAVVVVMIRWKSQWVDLVYPILGVTLHASVPILGKLRRQESVRHDSRQDLIAN